MGCCNHPIIKFTPPPDSKATVDLPLHRLSSNSNFIRLYQSELSENYKLTIKLGEGGFATVYQATDIRTGMQRAVKIIAKTGDDD